MNGYWHIVRYEIFGLFISPATYIACFYFLALLGVGFRFFIEGFAATDWILPPLASLVIGLIFGAPALVPFLTMRSFAEERRLGTLETMMTAPIGSMALVLGKWTASITFFMIISCMVFCYPLLLCYAFPDQGISLGFHLFEQWIGAGVFLFGFGCSFTAVGIFASSLTNNQMVAGMLSFTLLTLYLTAMAFDFGESIDHDNIYTFSDFLGICLGSLNQGLNKAQHFAVGVVDVSTLLHQFNITCLFLWLTTLQVEKLKL